MNLKRFLIDTPQFVVIRLRFSQLIPAEKEKLRNPKFAYNRPDRRKIITVSSNEMLRFIAFVIKPKKKRIEKKKPVIIRFGRSVIKLINYTYLTNWI